MRLAIAASRAALDAGDMPFGATLVSPDGQVLMVARNNQVTSGDCTGHAETVLVRDATARLGAQALRNATVYASGEPCAMCSGAMFWAGIRRVVFAATQSDIAEALGGAVLPIGCAAVLAASRPAVEVDGPLLADEANAVLRSFSKGSDSTATRD
jgi:tRNA(Arg) A34 adenosine deaminase TadA